MIINSGMRTDIPAFYSKWLSNRLKKGFVLVRNPYKRNEVIKYTLKPDVVDVLSFCSKNPEPLFPYLDDINQYRQYWHVTITPYKKEIEPNIPDDKDVIASFKYLSSLIGKERIAWRYDPIFIDEKYPLEFHIEAFSRMSEELKGYTNIAIISFIDLYFKTKNNFPNIDEVREEDKSIIGKTFSKIAYKNGMVLKTCAEGNSLSQFGVDTSGCMTQKAIEDAVNIKLDIPKASYKRDGCTCLLHADIGAYNSCMHLCKYCYANSNKSLVIKNYKNHNPDSPILIGEISEQDKIYTPKQCSWIDRQGFFNL